MSTREITLDLPAEPGPNGIVTDTDKVAWQRRDPSFVFGTAPGPPRRWVATSATGDTAQVLTWPELVAIRQPITVRWEGDVEAPTADLGNDA